MFKVLQRNTGFRLVDQLNKPTTRTRALRVVLMTFVRLFSALLLCLRAKMKDQIRRADQKNLLQLEECQQCKDSLELMESEGIELADGGSGRLQSASL